MCPGESNCSDFEEARGETREQKENSMCIGCSLFPSKPRSIANQFMRVIQEAEYARQKRDSGFGISLNEISPLARGAILYFDALESDYRQRQQNLLIKKLSGIFR